MQLTNRQCRLAARPEGLPKPSDWDFVDAAVAAIADGEFLVRVEYLSIDAAMRGWMTPVRSYIPPVEIGDVMRAAAMGRVIQSRHLDFQVGDYVNGAFGVQEYAVSDGEGVRVVDLALGSPATHLGVLGLSGLTAYFGILDVGKPQPGQTVVVSGAAGSVGSIAGQIARLQECRTIGIAGGPAKCDWLVKELGFDAAIDYKSQNVRRQLRELAPQGVDVFLDNVGGDVLDDVLVRLAPHARVVISGAISQYNTTEGMRGPANYMQLLVSRASMTGFVIFDYAKRYREALTQLAGWLDSGALHAREDVVEADIDDFPDVLLSLFRGANTGKLAMALPAALGNEGAVA
ncbi:NADP-dependent oxidoreductase [Streptomyces sp. NPDC101234]|uniref:NADP-dependent oxidoreductase n=1 Tax=Streptomyces sp. NPDC101234 TaxID=3366138 RepID=UPI0037F790F8